MKASGKVLAFCKTAALRLWLNHSGQDMIEYALLAGFVAVAAGAIFPTSLMPNVSAIFSKLGVYFSQAATQGT
jgi:Flp pilus assembly pilin Flp